MFFLPLVNEVLGSRRGESVKELVAQLLENNYNVYEVEKLQTPTSNSSLTSETTTFDVIHKYIFIFTPNIFMYFPNMTLKIENFNVY